MCWAWAPAAAGWRPPPTAVCLAPPPANAWRPSKPSFRFTRSRRSEWVRSSSLCCGKKHAADL
eukprot:15439752-Alexandrium_andersonii.AAC.1